MEELPDDLISNSVLKKLDAKSLGCMAAINHKWWEASRTTAEEHATTAIEACENSCGRTPTRPTEDIHRRNLRIHDAARRKSKVALVLLKLGGTACSSKLEQYEGKVARLNDEIFYAADGARLSDLEYVSDASEV